MANPKKRTSSRKRNTRRSHHRLNTASLIRCNNCQSEMLPHRVCPKCGYYKGRQIVETEW